jgi:hypothetical protein
MTHQKRSSPTLTALLALTLAAPFTGCGSRCPAAPGVRLVFSRPLTGLLINNPDHINVKIAGSSYDFLCPSGPQSGARGPVLACGYEAIEMTLPGLDIDATTEAVLTITAPDGSVLAKDLTVPLGPVQVGYPNGESKVCARVGKASL